MQTNISEKWSLLIVSIVGIASSSAILMITFFSPLDLSTPDSYVSAGTSVPIVSQTPQNLVASEPVETILGVFFPEQANAAPPDLRRTSKLSMRLKIPKIKVDAIVETVGLTANGEMGVPKGAINVALFDRGPRPGETGSAVITGHYGLWRNGKDSVFDKLHTLKKGDVLHIKKDDGTTVSFVVRELRTYGEHEDATEVFSSDDGKAHLNLITCAGVWNKLSATYSQRLVVLTDKE
jgi:LPXTG-site transpeptidase (sortase) family protein